MEPTDQGELDDLLNTARITRIVNSYFRALDEKNFDEAHFRKIFAPEGKIVRPNGAAVTGPANIVISHTESFARFEATQHLLTGHDVAIEDDTAVVRTNLVAIHIWKDRPADASMLERSFNAGGVITTKLQRLPDGWRIVEVANRNLWRAGDFGDMAQTR